MRKLRAPRPSALMMCRSRVPFCPPIAPNPVSVSYTHLIPIVNALEHALVGNKALTIAGIVNGTTNYILSRMDAEGLDFADVLADAQRLGYAEADPTADVDGFDAASKLAILSSIAFHTRVTTDDVYMQGIRNVSAIDIEQARELGMKVKLLAVCLLYTSRCV